VEAGRRTSAPDYKGKTGWVLAGHWFAFTIAQPIEIHKNMFTQYFPGAGITANGIGNCQWTFLE